LRTKHFHGGSTGNPHPYLLKSGYGKARNFRGKLRLALNDLKEAHIIDDWMIDKNDLVHVKRGEAISESQKR
jgi:hypothetical protein